jgi:ATP-binding cassette subfamily G (WHITE) protein 2 (PDR)
MSVALGIEEKVVETQLSPAAHVENEASSISDCGAIDANKSEERRNHEIHSLVRKFTARSAQQNLESPFVAAEGSGLDPNSDQFRAKDWARAFYNLRYNSEETIPRVAGLAFRDLNVWGKGSPTDFQSTVGNKILKLPSLFGRGSQKIEILRNLDGLLLPGEQLCVLGPPGQAHLCRFIVGY